MWQEIVVGISVGVGLALIAVLGKKFSEVVILKRDLSTCWKKLDHFEKLFDLMYDKVDKLNTKVAVLESRNAR
jgi:uncharacterized membrane protein YhiD involved in acid resistance